MIYFFNYFTFQDLVYLIIAEELQITQINAHQIEEEDQ